MKSPFASAAAFDVSKRSQPFAGAAFNRFTANWIFNPLQSANQEAKAGLSTLVRRVRELTRNDPYARRCTHLLDYNVIGPAGIKLIARNKLPTDEFDKATNSKIERAFAEWCRPSNCTVDGRSSFRDVCGRSIKGVARDGEGLIRLIPAFDNPFGFALQELDPDQLDIDYTTAPGRPGENRVVMGVEIDSWNRAVAFHIWSEHPSEAGKRVRNRIAADDIIHLFIAERPGLVRGVPWFIAAMIRLHMLNKYAEAELIASQIGASKMGFYEWNPDLPGMGGVDPSAKHEDLRQEVEPGMLEQLPFGMTFKPTNWDHPTNAFDPFNKSILRSVATGFDVAYSSLTGDLSDVNYSSTRIGKLDERDMYMTVQNWVIEHLCCRVYAHFLKWSLTTGALKLDSRLPDKYAEHKWQPRRWSWTDPEKEVDASIKSIAAGLDSRTRVCGEQGLDFEEILADLDREQQLAEEYGVELKLLTSVSGPAKKEESDEDSGTAGAKGRTANDLSGNGHPDRAAGGGYAGGGRNGRAPVDRHLIGKPG